MASPEQQGSVCGDEVGGPRTEPSPTCPPPNVLGGTDTARMGNYLLLISLYPRSGAQGWRGDACSLLYQSCQCNRWKSGCPVSTEASLCPFLLKRDRGTWQVRGGGPLSADCSAAMRLHTERGERPSHVCEFGCRVSGALDVLKLGVSDLSGVLRFLN